MEKRLCKIQRMDRIEAICGSMLFGKTEELICWLKRVLIANQPTEIFKSARDNWYADFSQTIILGRKIFMKHLVGLAFLRQWMQVTSLFIGFSVLGQDIAIGTWRTHFSYSNAKILAIIPDKIFCASENGLFSLKISSGTTRKLSKIDGLSDVGVSAMAYSESDRMLVIGYRSGLVDLVFEDEIISISEIATSTLEGDKNINDIVFGAKQTFLATNFGVVVFNIADVDISENYIQIGMGGSEVEVRELVLRNDSLFALTSEGIQSGNLGENLLDFNNWQRYGSTDLFTDLTLAGRNLFSLNGADLMSFSGRSWQDTGVELPSGASKLFIVGDNLMTASSDGVFYQFNGSTFEFVIRTSTFAVNDIKSIKNELYIADGSKGLVNQIGDRISPNGPKFDHYSSIKIISNKVYGFHTPDPFSYDGTEKISGYSFFSEGEWSIQKIDGFQNISDIALFKGTRYFTSLGDGLYNEGTGEVLTDIPSSASGPDTLLTAIKSGDRLWIVGFNEQQPTHFTNESGTWQSYSAMQVFDNSFLSVDISETGIAWLGSGSGTITIIDADQNVTERISIAEGLPSPYTDIEISVEDNAWVATSRGATMFSDASFILTQPNTIAPSFGNEILFENERINAIVTDGGNRIWFGTNRGLWVFDENVSEQVALFNESNSPIPSNMVLQLAYNGTNGEIFIITDKGMVSFRSNSSIGNEDHRNVSIFPNPVRPDYLGLVGLVGLAKNVIIKITDINGNIVNEIEANGGTASWDLLDMRRGEVVTGIYYFFSTTSDGKETFVGKIAVIR